MSISILFPNQEMQKQIQEKIKNNTKFLDEINQYLHNKGVELVKRYDIIIGILLKKETTDLTSVEIIEWVKAKLSTISIEKNEIYT